MTSDTFSFLLALGCVAALVLALYIVTKFPSCQGECRQGRDKCDCRNQE